MNGIMRTTKRYEEKLVDLKEREHVELREQIECLLEILKNAEN